MTNESVLYSDIGQRLEAIRLSFSTNNKTLWADINGFNLTQYSNWISGNRRIPIEAAERLCDKYELTLGFIYRGRLGSLPDSVRSKLEPHLPQAAEFRLKRAKN